MFGFLDYLFFIGSQNMRVDSILRLQLQIFYHYVTSHICVHIPANEHFAVYTKMPKMVNIYLRGTVWFRWHSSAQLFILLFITLIPSTVWNITQGVSWWPTLCIICINLYIHIYLLRIFTHNIYPKCTSNNLKLNKNVKIGNKTDFYRTCQPANAKEMLWI